MERKAKCIGYMIMKIEDCEGCLTLNPNGDKCMWFNKKLICPCSICLIKVMCSTDCKILKKYIDKVYNLKIGEYNEQKI